MKYMFAITLLVLSNSSFSGENRFGFGLGRGDINISAVSNESDINAGDSSLTTFLYVGYVFKEKIVLDLVYGSITDDLSFGIGDNVHLDTYEALLGYRFYYNKIYLEPKLGYARWDFDLKEGALLNPGPENEIEDSGFDPLFSLVAGYKFSSKFGASISYKYLDFEYGKASSVYLGLDFEF